jgi:hypothetical protein
VVRRSELSVVEFLVLLVVVFSVSELLGLLVELLVLVVVVVSARELLGLLVELLVLVEVLVSVFVELLVAVDVLELPVVDCALVLPSASAAPDIITARKNAEVVARYFACMALLRSGTRRPTPRD